MSSSSTVTRVKEQPSHVGGVAALSVSSTQATSFVSVGSCDGVVRLWDLRVQRRPDLLSVSLAGGLLNDAEAVHYRGDDRTACVAAGNRLVFLDFRKPMEAQSVVEFSSDLLALGVIEFPSAAAATPANSTVTPLVVVAEDHGELNSLWWPSTAAQAAAAPGAPGPKPPQFSLPQANPPRNVCAGFGLTTSTATVAKAGDKTTLWSAYMDGRLLGFRRSGSQSSATNDDSQVDRLTVAYDTNVSTWSSSSSSAAHGSAKTSRLCNPPLPTSLSCLRDYLCIGTASGEYSIFQLVEQADEEADDGDDDGQAVGDSTGDKTRRNDEENGSGGCCSRLSLELALSAPGHESVGLVAADLMLANAPLCGGGHRPEETGMHLLTVAISGEITLWNVGPMLVPLVVEDDDGDVNATVVALPEVVFADALRNRHDKDSRSCVVNCVARSAAGAACPSSLWVGDDLGYVYHGTLALS